jgi:hypothetical protein
MEPSAFLKGMTRETTIRRDADGVWYYDGEPLDHPNLTRAFDRWIERAPDDDGRYCLKNDINWAYFTLEGAPYFVERVQQGADGQPVIQLSNDQELPLPVESLRLGPEGALYCDVPGGMVAKFRRHAMAQLEPWLAEDDSGAYLELKGERVRPEVVSDPLQVRT